VVRTITTGERALTGQTLITEFAGVRTVTSVTLRSWHMNPCPFCVPAVTNAESVRSGLFTNS
jgi:hypothetical protein